MSSSVNKDDGPGNCSQSKDTKQETHQIRGGGNVRKHNDKADQVKKYYKQKQQDMASSPIGSPSTRTLEGDVAQGKKSPTPQQQSFSKTSSGAGGYHHQHGQNQEGRGHEKQKSQNSGRKKGPYSADKSRRPNNSQNWQSYGQMKNYGRRDLKSDFEGIVGEGRMTHMEQEHHMGYDGSGQKDKRQGQTEYVGQAESPRQGQGPRRNVSNQNKSRQNKGGANAKRPKCFEEYWKKEDVQAGLKRGQLVQGPVRINLHNYEEAYVAHPDGQSDIYIRGMSTRNRALNGDTVAVLLETRDNWKVNIAKMEESADVLTELVQKCKISTASENSDVVVEEEYEELADKEPREKIDFHPSDSGPPKNTKQNRNPTELLDSSKPDESGSTKPAGHGPADASANGKTPKKDGNTKSDGSKTPKKTKAYTALKDLGTENSGSSKLEEIFSPTKIADKLKDVHDSIPNEYLQRTGKVVYIIEKTHSRACTGHIRPSNRANFALFAPTDHRVPRINIPIIECPQAFKERPEDHAKTLFVARITDWSEDQMMPLGTLARSLGEAGEIEPETEGILISYDVDFGEFPQQSLDCLPAVSAAQPWRIPASEFDYRRDFRQECVFTIDPPTARDLDDALHVIDLGNDEYEVGVHIADVSYFVNHDTALDTVAASRATSVYLVQKVIPMLPRLLCEQLCSLNPDEDRLTFSVVWRMTGEGQILDEWFGRSVICSCVKLGYNHAQGFLDQPERDWTEAELPPISAGHEPEVIKQKVLILNKIAKSLRRKRYVGGALSLNQVKMQYTLDKDTGMPCGYSVYKQQDSNRLIEEFMLLANMAVAHKIYTTFPEFAVLRRHPAPQQKMVDELQELLENLGMPVNCSSAKTIQESLSQYTGGDLQSDSKCHILTALCAKAMQLAKYFCTGMFDDDEQYRHYALSVPLYTHFTSPIRRYPDIMVHRALAAALDYKELPDQTKEALHKQCTHCNEKKIAAKSVQDLSNNLYFAAFVKECGPLEERGMVMGLTGKCFDVLLFNLGIVRRVFVEKLEVESSKFRVNHKKPEMLLVWKSDKEHPTQHRQTLSIFTPVNCVLTAGDEPLKFNCLLKHPEDALQTTELPQRSPEETRISAIVVNYEDV